MDNVDSVSFLDLESASYSTSTARGPRQRGRAAQFREVATFVLASTRWRRLQPSVQHNYKVSFEHVTEDLKDELQVLVKDNNVEKLVALGGVNGVARSLRTDPHTGIGWPVDQEMRGEPSALKQEIEWELQSRRQTFGVNRAPAPARRNGSLLWQVFKDEVLLDTVRHLITFCGVLLSVLSRVDIELQSQLHDGFVILSFVAIDVGISMGSSYWMRSTLLRHSTSAKEHVKVQVIRFGRRWFISPDDIVVGDIVELRCGDRVPADGLILDGSHSLQISSDGLADHEGRPILPFLTLGTIVQCGSGIDYMLITAVGNESHESSWHGSSADNDQEMLVTKSSSQDRLQGFKSLLFQLRLYISVLFMLVLLPFYFLGSFSAYPSGKFTANTRAVIAIYNLVYEFYESMSFFEAAVPNGLFIMIPLATVHVINRIQASHISIPNPVTFETKLGFVTTMCIGKAGVITENVVNVEGSWIAGFVYDTTRSEERAMVNEPIRLLLSQGIAMNTTGNLHKEAFSEGFESMSCGSAMEKGLLKWAYKNCAMDIEGTRRTFKTLKVDPFHPDTRRSGVAITYN